MKSLLLTIVVIIFSTAVHAQSIKSELKSLDGTNKSGSSTVDNATLQKQERNARPDLKQNLKSNSGTTNSAGSNNNSNSTTKKPSVGISNQQIKKDINNTSSKPRTNSNKSNTDMDKLKTL